MESSGNGHIYIAIPLMALLAIVQSSILPRFPIAGVAPQLLFIVALGWGLLRGLEEGLIWAFIAGLFVDLFSLAPMGVSSLAFMAGMTPILLRRVLPPRRLLVASLMGALGTIIYLLAYTLLLQFTAFGVTISGMLELLPLILIHAVIITPVYLLLDYLLRITKPRRVEF
ncbi:MAG: rod shape-determining protein MreD [Candidatus Promineofilum sp.]|nr:rod shape-determining protein MreD [Promineifilum sp.]